MARLGKTARRMAVAAAVLALAGVAGPAAAGNVSGENVVLEKSLESRTLRLDSGLVLKVTDSTRIMGPNGNLLPLSAVPAGRRVGDGWQLKGNEAIRFEARTAKKGQAVADEIQVLGVPLE